MGFEKIASLMHCIHTIASTRLDHGGTSRSVPATCDALVAAGVTTKLITARPADADIKCNAPSDSVEVHWARESAWLRQWGVSRQFIRALDECLSESDGATVVHDHALWLPTNHTVAKFCRRHQLTRVVSTRGMLSAWALANGGLKKRLAWRLYQHSDLKTATAFHATSQLEADEIRRLGFQQPIAVIPNGISIPAVLPKRQQRRLRTALFLSRIHPVKGLINLVRAWSQANIQDDWQLVVAGPDENGHRTEVEYEVHKLGLCDRVSLVGEIDNELKWQTYVDSDLFILPSFSENFGIVVAEAMAAGVPVIATTGTPWCLLNEHKLGWWVEPTVKSLAVAIAEACAEDPIELRRMGVLARAYATAQFSWTDVGKRLKSFYEEILRDS